MCLILFAYESHSKYRLVFAANRDEFYNRPTQPIAFWDEAPYLLAGKDLKDKGTWLGITRNGRISAITNFRDPPYHMDNAPSRGALVKNFLTGEKSPQHYLAEVQSTGSQFNGFNLLTGDQTGLWYTSNRLKSIKKIIPGLYGLSNHLLDTPWPKIQKGKAALQNLLEKKVEINLEDLFSILEDKTRPPDHTLPNTGVGLDKERMLSPLFITSDDYGTRSTSIILIDKNGKVTFEERTFISDRNQNFKQETRHFDFSISEKS